jgi:hypothetical protein
MNKVDILYLCHGRLEFTKATLPTLLQNTDWSRVNEFVVYNDAAPDHPLTYEYLHGTVADVYEGMTVRDTNIGSPVGVMNHYLARSQKARIFAKIDNDIVVPPGWLETMLSVMESDPDLMLLGMEPGMSGLQPIGENDPAAECVYSYLPATHIGGVGLMRRQAFDSHPPLIPDGRFGFTEWQHTYEPVRGWIQPDLRCFPLDMIPVEPWKSITDAYKKVPGGRLQRDWATYDEKMSWYWSWWTDARGSE